MSKNPHLANFVKYLHNIYNWKDYFMPREGENLKMVCDIETMKNTISVTHLLHFVCPFMLR